MEKAPPRRRMMRCLNSSSLRPTPRAIFWRSIYRLRCVSAATSIPYGWSRQALSRESLRALVLRCAVVTQNRLWRGYIYVVIEHQSSPDAQMAFRLMRYAIAAMQRHLDGGHYKTAAGGADAVLSRSDHAIPVVTQLAGLFCRSTAGE